MLASHLLLRRAQAVGRFEMPTERTDATTQAAANFERNKAALERSWPRAALCLPDHLPELEWLYARDGTLSARHVDRQWFGDCSVPALAAERMFATFRLDQPTAVLLAPTHGQQIRCVLDRLASDQALIVVIPGEYTAGVAMACVDFTAAITAGRLWIAAGPDWSAELQQILDRNDGIAPASMMIRVPGLNSDVVDAVFKPCETMLAKHAQAHRQRLDLLLAKQRVPHVPARRVCVVGGAFRLWNDAEDRLKSMASEAHTLVDAANPAQRSALCLARAADGCDAIVTANMGRSDQPGVVPMSLPWQVWATTRVPAHDKSAPLDTLTVADETMRPLAVQAGWPVDRVSVASEPIDDLPALSFDARVAVLADCPTIALPAAIEEMSSHRIVWDAIERDLTTDPLRLTRAASADAYVRAWCDRIGVPIASFPTALVLDALIAPLFIREVTRGLVQRGAAIEVWGRGWGEFEAVRPIWRGAIDTRSRLHDALSHTRAIVDLWPLAITHPSRRTGRVTIGTDGRSWEELLAAIAGAKGRSPRRTTDASFRLGTAGASQAA